MMQDTLLKYTAKLFTTTTAGAGIYFINLFMLISKSFKRTLYEKLHAN